MPIIVQATHTFSSNSSKQRSTSLHFKKIWVKKWINCSKEKIAGDLLKKAMEESGILRERSID